MRRGFPVTVADAPRVSSDGGRCAAGFQRRWPICCGLQRRWSMCSMFCHTLADLPTIRRRVVPVDRPASTGLDRPPSTSEDQATVLGDMRAENRGEPLHDLGWSVACESFDGVL
jgi:hypothetical protein